MCGTCSRLKSSAGTFFFMRVLCAVCARTELLVSTWCASRRAAVCATPADTEQQPLDKGAWTTGATGQRHPQHRPVVYGTQRRRHAHGAADGASHRRCSSFRATWCTSRIVVVVCAIPAAGQRRVDNESWTMLAPCVRIDPILRDRP